MKEKIFFLLFIIFTNCAYKVDRTNIFKVGEAINESFIKKDTTILKQLFQYGFDNIDNAQRNRLKEIQAFFEKKPIFLTLDTTTTNRQRSFFDDFFISNNYINLYYENDGLYYNISSSYKQDSLKNFFINSIRIDSLSQICDEYNKMPYCPKWSVDFKDITWRTDFYATTFKYGTIRVQNNTNQDISYMKFRVILKNRIGKSLYYNTFFNQTIESTKHIYKGDIATLDIPGLTDYYTGFTIKKENMQFLPDLIEIKPKPESAECKKIEELKRVTNKPH